jgi:glycosyltransferase involved in cell wall biosynthesis
MRIVYLSPSAQLGGAEAALLDVLAAVRETEPEWELVLIASEPGPLLDRASRLGVQVEIEPMPATVARMGDAALGGLVGTANLASSMLLAAPWALAYLRALRRRLAALAPEVIHTNGFKMHLLGIRAAPSQSAVVWHIHDFVGRRRLMSRALRAHAPRVAAAVTNSASVARDVVQVCGSGLRVVPILNAVDLRRFSPEGSRVNLDQLSGLPEAGDVVRIGMLATMARWKGHEVFLRALALLKAEARWRGHVIGGPLYRTHGSEVSLDGLRDLRDQLGLRDRVGFTGFLQDVPAAMRSLDLIVHASTEPEPFGLVIIEGLACGRPVLVSDAGGASEILASVRGAIGYPPGDAVELARKIGQLVDDRECRESMGREGRASVSAKFDRARLGPAFARLYREVAG